MKQFYSSDENIFYTFKCISEECSKLFCIVQIITGIIYFATLQKLFYVSEGLLQSVILAPSVVLLSS